MANDEPARNDKAADGNDEQRSGSSVQTGYRDSLDKEPAPAPSAVDGAQPSPRDGVLQIALPQASQSVGGEPGTTGEHSAGKPDRDRDQPLIQPANRKTSGGSSDGAVPGADEARSAPLPGDRDNRVR